MKLSFRIKKDIDFVFVCLTDMKKLVTVHPVIYRIDDTGNERYLVYETLKFGFVPFSFTYPVSIEKSELNRTVIIRATVFRLTKIEMKFLLKSDGDYTIIEEDTRFKSPLPVAYFMERIFRKQHSQLFENIGMK
jgi:carbon monoxide dehydrogenase subunit G